MTGHELDACGLITHDGVFVLSGLLFVAYVTGAVWLSGRWSIMGKAVTVLALALYGAGFFVWIFVWGRLVWMAEEPVEQSLGFALPGRMWWTLAVVGPSLVGALLLGLITRSWIPVAGMALAGGVSAMIPGEFDDMVFCSMAAWHVPGTGSLALWALLARRADTL